MPTDAPTPDRIPRLWNRSPRPQTLRRRKHRTRLTVEVLEDRTMPSASIATNLPDYSPGQTAVITGSGFQANETVDLQVLNESVTPAAPAGSPGSWTVQADASGAFQTSWLCTSDLAGANLELDAKGESSGLTASEAFTDSTRTNLSLNINPGTVTFGGSVTFTATLTAGSSNTPLSGQNIDFSTGSTDSNGVATLTVSPVSLPASSTAYTITAAYTGIPSQFTSANATGSLTVNSATPTVMASAANEQYDGVAYDLSNVTHTISPGNATGTYTDVFYSDAAGTHVIADPTNVGTYYVQVQFVLSDPTQWANANSNITSFQITKANATIHVTPYSVTYDGSAHTATATATGVGGVDLSAELNLSSTTHTNVGTYTDTWTFTDTTGNYTHVFNGTITDSITQATPSGTVGPDDIPYGTALDGSQLGGSLGGVAGSFAFTGPDNGAVLHVSGSPYTEAYTFTPTDTADYNPVRGAATVNVSPVPLKVTADGQEITYGDALPAFTATAKGLVNGDTLASLGVAFGGDSQTAVHAGTYTITVSGPTTSDYTVIDVPGTLTIDQATLILKEDNATMFVGAALPTFTGSIVSGVVDHDNVSLSFQAVDSHGNPVTGNTLGTFAIVATPNNSDYQVAYAPQGTLSVLPVIANTAVVSTRPSSSPSQSNGSSQPASPGFDFMTAFQALELDVFYLTLYEAAAAAVSFADPVLDYYVNVLLMALYGNPLAFTPSGTYAEVLGAEMAQPFLTPT